MNGPRTYRTGGWPTAIVPGDARASVGFRERARALQRFVAGATRRIPATSGRHGTPVAGKPVMCR